MRPYNITDGKKLRPGYLPYIIDELSANHNGDINRAFQIMAGARDAMTNPTHPKTYTPNTIASEFHNEVL